MTAMRQPRTARQEAAAYRAVAAADYHLPRIPAEYRFALVRDLTRRTKALVYPEGLAQLARSIHRMRQGQTLQLEDRRQRILGEEDARRGVTVWTKDADGWAWRGLGWAWLDGADWRTLRDALAAEQPEGSGVEHLL